MSSANDHDQTIAANRAGYDCWSDFYDQYPNPTVAADDLAFPAFWAHLHAARILEIGCGTGRHTVRLARAGNHVTGIDLSPGMLEQARRKLAGLPVTLIQGDIMAGLDIPGAPFDAALTSLVIEHIGDLPAFFARIHALLVPGGRFYLSEIHPDRTAAGTFAHFKTAEGSEVALSGYPHSAAAVDDAAQAAGFVVETRHDVTGDTNLAALNPKWHRHLGRPMLLIRVLRRPLPSAAIPSP